MKLFLQAVYMMYIFTLGGRAVLTTELNPDLHSVCLGHFLGFSKLLHLLFGVLRNFGTLMEWNRKQSHDCSELFLLPRFSSRGNQNRHMTLPIFT
jgi:hypothetical protein